MGKPAVWLFAGYLVLLGTAPATGPASVWERWPNKDWSVPQALPYPVLIDLPRLEDAGTPAPEEPPQKRTLYPLEKVFKECLGRDPCIIRYSGGGYLWQFEDAALRVLRGERSLIIIDGICASACAVFADFARKSVCITPRADFQFHKARTFKKVRAAGKVHRVVDTFSDPPHRPDIRAWVAAKGGFPKYRMLPMPLSEARKFWRTCVASDMPRAAPKPRVRPTRI